MSAVDRFEDWLGNTWVRHLVDSVLLAAMLVALFAGCLLLLRFGFGFITS